MKTITIKISDNEERRLRYYLLRKYGYTKRKGTEKLLLRAAIEEAARQAHIDLKKLDLNDKESA
jgi:bacillopeptidase F (M6 metalloprotease family)